MIVPSVAMYQYGRVTSALFALFLLVAPGFVAPGPAAAAVVGVAPGAAPPLSQTFLSERVSVVAKGDWRACSVRVPLDVDSADYVAPGGRHLAFGEVVRSVAAGMSVLRPVGDAPGDLWRIDLKYPLAEVGLRVGDTVTDLADAVAPAGDTVTLPEALKPEIRAAWAAGEAVTLEGRSADTGNRVGDRLPAPDPADLTLCRAWQEAGGDLAAVDGATLEAASLFDAPEPREIAMAGIGAGAGAGTGADVMAELWRVGLAAPVPAGQGASTPVPTPALFAPSPRRNGALSLTWEPGDPDAAPPKPTAACRIRDVDGTLSHATVRSVSGAALGTAGAWLRHAPSGELVQVYVPGLFDAVRDEGTGDWTADVSIAALSNDPRAAPRFKGCLGTVAIPMARDGTSLAEIPGGSVPGAIPAAFAPGGGSGGGGFPLVLAGGGGSSTSITGPTPSGPGSPGPGGIPRRSTGGGSGTTTERTPPDIFTEPPFSPPFTDRPPGDSGSDDSSDRIVREPPEDERISPVPLPLTAPLLALALAGLAGMRIGRRAGRSAAG